MFTEESNSSNCVTALCPVNQNVDADKVFEVKKIDGISKVISKKII